MYARLGKILVKILLQHQNRFVRTFQKCVFKQVVGGAEGKSEITAILNKYKDIFNDLIDSSDIESPD